MTHSFPTRRSSDLPQAISLCAAKEGSAGSAAVAEGRCSNIAKDGASAWAETCTAGTVIMSIPIIPYLIIFRLVALPRIDLERMVNARVYESVLHARLGGTVARKVAVF